MNKNTAGKWLVFAFQDEGGANPGEPVTGDAANITATVYIDGVSNTVDDTNPTELAGGYYIFDLTATETNGDNLALVASSATANVNVIAVPGAVSTTPPNFNLLGIESDGDLTKVNTLHGHTAQTGDSYAYLGTNLGSLGANATEAGGTGDQFTALPDVTLADGVEHGGTTATFVGQSLTLSNASGSAVLLASSAAGDPVLDLDASGAANSAIRAQASGTAPLVDFNAEGNGDGINIACTGTGQAIAATTLGGHAVSLTAVAASKYAIYATSLSSHAINLNAQATSYGIISSSGLGISSNIQGNLSGSVGSVTGAVGSVTGNVGGNVVGSVASVTGNVGGIAGTITTLDGLDTAQDTQHATTLSKLLKYFQLLFRKDAAIATDNATELTAINADGGSGAGAYDNTTESAEALRDRGDASWITATTTTTSNTTAIADAVLGRAVENVEDTADKHSLAAMVMIGTNSSVSGGTLTAKKPSDDSTFFTYTVTSDSGANPITGVS